jgi:hypothetical protein
LGSFDDEHSLPPPSGVLPSPNKVQLGREEHPEIQRWS